MGEWRTGWPHDADPFDIVEVEYRNGETETAQVCEIDWSRADDNDPLSPLAEREVIRFRMVR